MQLVKCRLVKRRGKNINVREIFDARLRSTVRREFAL